jgi:pimeloyl-ACP methyl ester carboxylesterase
MSFALPTGAEARWTGTPGPRAVICVNGGTSAELPGTWSASIEWLVERLAANGPPFPFLEVRYRIKSWRRLPLCIEDARAAIDAARAAGAEEIALLGFSMGGAVSVHVADDPAVSTVIALAPWLHAELDVSTLDGRRFAVFHGSLDRGLPGVPGVRPDLSLRGYERAKARGVDASRQVIRGAIHPIALRTPWGRTVPMPRAGRWADLVASELARLCA